MSRKSKRNGASKTLPKTLTLLTATGARPEAWAICEKLMAGQDYSGPVRWVIVDDGAQPQPVTFQRDGWSLVVIRPEPFWQPGQNTQARNLAAGLAQIGPDELVAIIEDDDYYASDYLSAVSEWLKGAELVGEGGARYYNVAARVWRDLGNSEHASLCSTAVRGPALQVLRKAVAEQSKTFIDMRLWAGFRGRKALYPPSRVVGIKGMPGRGGIGVGHRMDGTADPQGEKLAAWLGKDASLYLELGAGSRREIEQFARQFTDPAIGKPPPAGPALRPIAFMGRNPASNVPATNIFGSGLAAVASKEFVVASIYGDNAQQAAQALELGQALEQLGIRFFLARTEGRESCAGDGALKANYIHNLWKEVDVPVVWLDIDASISPLREWFGSVEADFAVHNRTLDGGSAPGKGMDFSAGAIWFGKGAVTGQLLEQWEKRCQADPATTDGVHLAATWFDITARNPLRTVWLPRTVAPATRQARQTPHLSSAAGNEGPVVSILIPAYKPEYLQRAIASAQGQTFRDIEILVGDDTPDGRLADIVRQSADERTRYFHHGLQDGELNLRQLWRRARGRYVKLLFDDDILFPTSVEALLAALRANPGSALAFHERLFIDADDKVVRTPPALLEPGKVALLDHAAVVNNMLTKAWNFIGEPSNTMLDRQLVDIETVYTYRSLKLDNLADVASYLNLSRQAPIVAVGGYLSGFRRHPAQESNANSARRSAAVYEWELFVRGEAADGHLSGEALAAARLRLRQLYAEYTARYPEIAAFSAHLDELSSRNPSELFDSERYQQDLAKARSAVASRVALRGRKTDNYCAVCEQTVPEWLPHPRTAGIDMKFMLDLEVVGSRIDKHICPNCRCNDRDRHLWLYMQAAGLLEKIGDMRILHIAPERALEPRLRALQPREYVAGDLHPRRPGHVRIDVEALDFPAGYFDLIICNHVLEHVNHPDKAVAEFSRCLAPDGKLIAQTPYSPILVRTMEINRAWSQEFATYYYGQDDHVRLFGADITGIFRDAGLRGDLYLHTSVLGDIDPDAHGCNPLEPFFLFAKGSAPVFTQARP